MDNPISQKVTDAIIFGKEEALRLNNIEIGPEHILLGLIREGEGKAIEIFEMHDIDPEDIKLELETIIKQNKIDQNDYNEIELNLEASRIVTLSILEARSFHLEIADTEHILLALLKDEGNLGKEILENNGLYYDDVRNSLERSTPMTNGIDYDDEEDEDDLDSSPNDVTSTSTSSSTSKPTGDNNTPALDSFGTNFTKAAEEEQLDPVIGREKEIERMAQILSRRKKNNPILIGEPGVGKSALVEGLAIRINERKVSRALFGKRVIALDMAAVVAGTKYRGQFEERIRTIIKELKNNPDIILFIDEIHTIIGAGSAPGGMDAANMLKPALARGEIQCIGATTLDEYRKNIEKDGALDRRFQKLMVEPTTAEETLNILQNIKDKYEDFHNVKYTDDALKACVKLTDIYITDRNFPDKAIDAIDEAGARAHVINISVPKEFDEQEELIEKIKVKKNDAVKAQNYELAASFRDKERELNDQYDKMKAEWESKLKEKKEVVDKSQIEHIVSMISGIPVQKMAQAEEVKLKNMKIDLQKQVIAQDQAIEKLTKAILRNRIGLKDPNKPIGSFMFLGPTGVGKTLLAKKLAEHMFGSPEALIRIDMSEYMEKFSVSRLVGAPPGYVGYDEGGQLTEKVRRKPYSIVLLDEIEKAHGDVFNILLQVLDDGILTDSTGRKVDFKNTVVIMTSNIGTRQLKDFGRGVGFAAINKENDKEYSQGIIDKSLKKKFAPEFLNRIDEIITFDQLSIDAIKQIVDLELVKLISRVEKIGYKLVVSDNAKTFIAKKGYDVQYGARPLKRVIQTDIEDSLAELIVDKKASDDATISVSVDNKNKKLKFSVKHAELD